MDESDSERLAAIISVLGGPTIDPANIEWAVAIPSGKDLIQWITAQVQDCGESEGVDRRVQSQVALRNIALEAAEVEILKHPKSLGISGESESHPHVLPGYLPPSKLNNVALYMNKEVNLVENETALIKSRLQQTKIASQKMSQTMKSLQSAIASTDTDIGRAQERIAELSLEADTAISTSVDGAITLLQSLGCQPSRPGSASEELDDPTLATISQLSSLRTSMIENLYSLPMVSIDKATQRLPTSTEVQSEASQLHQALLKFEDTAVKQKIEESAFEEELRRIIDLLDSTGEESDPLEEILREDYTGDKHMDEDLNVQFELERAWMLDQTNILKLKGQILDKTVQSFQNNLIESLTDLHTQLSVTQKQIRESEALLGALGEELEEIVDDVQAATEGSQKVPSKSRSEQADEQLEAELVQLFKDLKDIRPQDAPPLVLLQQDDILAELRALVDRKDILEKREEAWAAGLPVALNELMSGHAPLLTNIYEHSKMNTSPPFALPPDVAALAEDAKQKADRLGSEVGRLQKEAEALESSRVKRRLGTFVDKWVKA